MQVVNMEGVGSWYLWGFWYLVFSYHQKHSLKLKEQMTWSSKKRETKKEKENAEGHEC